MFIRNCQERAPHTLLEEGNPEHAAGKRGGNGRGTLCLSIFLFLVKKHALRNRSTFYTDSSINNQNSSERIGPIPCFRKAPRSTAGKRGGDGRGSLCLSIFLFLANEHALRNRSTFYTDSSINNQNSSESLHPIPLYTKLPINFFGKKKKFFFPFPTLL